MGPALFVFPGFLKRLPEDTEEALEGFGAFLMSVAEGVAIAGAGGRFVHRGPLGF